MSKKRKKHYQPGLQKIKDAQHRNEYFKRLGIFLKALTGEDVLALIPSEEKGRLYAIRTKVITAEPQEGDDVPSWLIEAIKGIVIWLFKKRPIPIEVTKEHVNIYQYYTFGVSLCAYVDHLKEVSYKNSERVKELLEPHFGDASSLEILIKKEIYEFIFPYLAIIANNYCYGFFTFSIVLKAMSDSLSARFVIQVKKHSPEKIHVVINNTSRMAYRVGWAILDSFTWCEVTPAQLGINSVLNNLTIPVYIQKHAWHRFTERLDCLPHDSFAICVYNSLTICKVVRDKNNFLIDFIVGDVKAGYLVAVLVDGKLIIRTFLFLTCSGTPEGKRLKELAGLQKLDTKYLMMDKLSTFMTAKISTNEELRSIFRKADCLHLLELFDNLDKYSRVHPDHSPLESISSYLKSNDVKQPEWEEEEEENIVSTLERSRSGTSPG